MTFKKAGRKGDEDVCNVKYTFFEDGSVAYGHLPDGIVFKEVAQ